MGGHVGIAGNERVDAIASGFAERKEVVLFSGERSAYEHEIENVAHDSGKASQRSAAKTRSSQKAYSYVSLVDGSVMVHKTWAACEARVRGKQARFKKALSPEDEVRIIQDFS